MLNKNLYLLFIINHKNTCINNHFKKVDIFIKVAFIIPAGLLIYTLSNKNNKNNLKDMGEIYKKRMILFNTDIEEIVNENNYTEEGYKKLENINNNSVFIGKNGLLKFLDEEDMVEYILSGLSLAYKNNNKKNIVINMDESLNLVYLQFFYGNVIVSKQLQNLMKQYFL